MKKIENINTGERFYSVRIALDMTQFELSQKLGITAQQVANYENERRKPSMRVIFKMMDLCAEKGIKLDARFLRPVY